MTLVLKLGEGVAKVTCSLTCSTCSLTCSLTCSTCSTCSPSRAVRVYCLHSTESVLRHVPRLARAHAPAPASAWGEGGIDWGSAGWGGVGRGGVGGGGGGREGEGMGGDGRRWGGGGWGGA